MKQRKRRFSSSLRCGPAQLLARGRIGLDLPKICFHQRAVPVHDVVPACLKSNLARLACLQGQRAEEAELFPSSSSSR